MTGQGARSRSDGQFSDQLRAEAEPDLAGDIPRIPFWKGTGGTLPLETFSITWGRTTGT